MADNKLEMLKAMVNKDPENPLARYGLANEYFKLKMFDEAVAQLNKYLGIKDDEGAAYRMLAQCHTELGDTDNAKAAYKKGIEAATKHGHPTMAEEFEEAIEFLDY